jgi:sporulation protein YlmC with PRC-barrel domain
MRSEHAVPVRRLERLSRMREYDVDRHEPDPRGWTVMNREGQNVGEVKDLIVDTERMAATYLDVELDTKLFDFHDDDPHVLVPIERARTDGNRLVVDDIGAEWVSELRAARARHHEEFWDRWWHRAEAREQPERVTRIRRRTEPEELQRAIDEVRPGQEVRIPVVKEVIKEEIVVERRPVEHEEVVVNRAADEPPRRR